MNKLDNAELIYNLLENVDYSIDDIQNEIFEDDYSDETIDLLYELSDQVAYLQSLVEDRILELKRQEASSTDNNGDSGH